MMLKLFVLFFLFGLSAVAAECDDAFERCADRFIGRTYLTHAAYCRDFKIYVNCLLSGCPLTTAEQRVIKMFMERSLENAGVENCDLGSSTMPVTSVDCDSTFDRCFELGEINAEGATLSDACRLVQQELDCIYAGCTFAAAHKELITSIIEIELKELGFYCDFGSNQGPTGYKNGQVSTMFLAVALVVLRNFFSEF